MRCVRCDEDFEENEYNKEICEKCETEIIREIVAWLNTFSKEEYEIVKANIFWLIDEVEGGMKPYREGEGRPYSQRVLEYELRKKKLWNECTSYEQYEREVQKLARELKI